MSSPCRCAGAIIAKPIAVATKPGGGKVPRRSDHHCPHAVVGDPSDIVRLRTMISASETSAIVDTDPNKPKQGSDTVINKAA